MSKTFKSTNDTDAPIHHLMVGESDGEVLVRVHFGNTHKGVLIDQSDVPALALAILEAAGVKVQHHPHAHATSPEFLELIAHSLTLQIQGTAAKAKVAADREALDAEALALYKAYAQGTNLQNINALATFTADEFRRMATAAREIHGAKS